MTTTSLVCDPDLRWLVFTELIGTSVSEPHASVFYCNFLSCVVQYILGISRDNILHVRGLETAPDTTKSIIVMPVVLADLGNQTVLSVFAMCRINYNHFQTGRVITESWSRSVQDTSMVKP